MGYSLKYSAPGPVAAAFLRNRPAALSEETLPIDGIIGPIGGGKTVCSTMRIFCHALEQPPAPDGWRRSRWAVVRNTNPMLETTTIQTWLEWFPEAVFGRFNWSPPYSHTIRLADQKVELEMWFIPLDRPEQVRNLLSMELTGLFVNEAREVPREILIAGRSRCGRYPSLRSGVEPGWAGVLFDTNAPEDEMHYIAMWAGWTQPPEWMDRTTRQLMFKPDGITIFTQPPGLIAERNRKGEVEEFKPNPKAENLKNIRPGYYSAQLAGNTVDWVLNMCCVEMRRSGATRPVHTQFRDAVHVAAKPIQWKPDGGRLLLGGDFARNPAVVVAQEQDGVLCILRELVGENVSVEVFYRTKVVPALNDSFPGWQDKHFGWGDPSGSNRTGSDDMTAFRHVQAQKVRMVPCWTNDPAERQASFERRLTRLSDGGPAILIDPRCQTLVAGLKGGYRFKKLAGAHAADRFAEEVDKNEYSHICEAAEYLTAGLDRGARQDQEQQRRAARQTQQPNGRVKVDPFAAARAARRRR
jgi:hypothetical protein